MIECQVGRLGVLQKPGRGRSVPVDQDADRLLNLIGLDSLGRPDGGGEMVGGDRHSAENVPPGEAAGVLAILRDPP